MLVFVIQNQLTVDSYAVFQSETELNAIVITLQQIAFFTGAMKFMHSVLRSFFKEIIKSISDHIK